MELICVLVAFVIVFISQQILTITYSKYKKVRIDSNLTGADVARKILNEYDLNNIEIRQVSGDLSDNYNNNRKRISLSNNIYNGSTIASCAVAAHECGHAIQYKEGYVPIKIRNLLVPFVNLGNSLGYIVIIISLFSSFTKLFKLGLILISFALIFQLITLPVEFDASKRANKILLEMGLITKKEQAGTKAMLKAAAFTYVAGLISSIMQILRIILIFTGRSDD